MPGSARPAQSASYLLPTAPTSWGTQWESPQSLRGSRERGKGQAGRVPLVPSCIAASQVAIASPAGQRLWSLGAISSTGIWVHRCEMKITQLFTLFDFVLLSLGSKNSCSSRSLEIGGLQSTGPYSATTKDKHGPTATSTKPL